MNKGACEARERMGEGAGGCLAILHFSVVDSHRWKEVPLCMYCCISHDSEKTIVHLVHSPSFAKEEAV